MLTTRCLYLLLCVNIALLAFYLAIDYQLVFHSDSAVKNLLAQEIHETGQYFPRAWNYANGDLWVFNTHTFILALLPLLGNGYAAHAASGLVSAALILYGAWLLTGMLEQRPPARLAGMLVVSAGMSPMMAEHVYGQAAYGSIFYMGCFLLRAYWSLSQARGARRLPWAGATAALTVLVFWSNPQRALLVYALPLLAAAGVQLSLARRDGGAARAHWAALAVVLAAAVAGVLLNRHTLAQVNNNIGLSLIGWLDVKTMALNGLAVAQGVLSLFDGLPPPGAKVASAAGAYAALRLAGALLLLALLPWALYRGLRPERGPRQLVVVFTAVGFGLSLFLMATTTLADMTSPESSVRYLVPSLLGMLLILAGTLSERAGAPLARAGGIAALALLATSAPAAYLSPFSELVTLPREGLALLTPERRLAGFLRAQGLRYGYATFWVAGKTSVLSSGAVRVRQVEFERGLPQPMRKLSSDRWYAPAAWRGPTFVALRDSELALLDQPLLASYAGQPRLLRFEDMNVLVYPTNPAASLPSWDTDVSRPLRYAMDRHTLHQRGVLEHGAITTAPGEEGNLHFGPMRTLAPGSYAVSFELDIGTGAEAGAAGYGMVDVVSAAATQVLARQGVTAAGRQRVTLRFRTQQPLSAVEFRAFSTGRARFTLRAIDLERGAPAATAAPAVQEK
ncbi:hypothetical protein [Duganella sp. CF517]|uniref:hypothetical protein n=1 Tax=Duganella sp. CF517 TaxID=1881038 RepID=UPI000B7FF448|nr:hypothetical protein [Duganella sp. CF517]